jgi:COP9 signalosome complex subunit 12
LYVASKNLRTFAIKADEERNKSSDQDVGGNAYQDDYDPETKKNQQLTECANQLNRVFNLCLSDR